MRYFLLQIFIILLMFSSSVFSSELDNEKALNRIFSDAIKAVGSKKQINKVKSIEAFAKCVGPKGKYTTKITSFLSRKTHFKQAFSYREKDSNIFINKNFAWQKPTPTSDISIVSPFQKMVVRLHEYQKMAFDFQKMFKDFKFIGDEIFNKKQSIKVSAKNELGGKIYLFFDKETKLLVGYILPIPNSKETVKNVFNEWKKVGKLKLPSKITATDSSGDWVLHFNKISLNKADEKKLKIPQRVQDLAELLRLHKQHQTAHLTYNVELFVETFAENLVTVQRGTVVSRNKDVNRKRIKGYFNSFKFKKWGKR